MLAEALEANRRLPELAEGQPHAEIARLRGEERNRDSWHLHADETTWRVSAPWDGSGPAK